MSFRDIDIKKRYRSFDTENIAVSFIQKSLEQSVSYKRAVGFFSSSSLIYTSRGLAKVAENYKAGEPVIKYIVSPRLTKEDVEAIRKGYQFRDIIEKALDRDFVDVTDEFAKERLNMISHLISSGAMDIKIAIMENDNEIGIYHEKIGIFTDEDGYKIAFEGSLNETVNAYITNGESIRVYRNWLGEADDCFELEYNFDNMWKNNTRKIKIYEFPNAIKERIFKYKKETYDKDIDKHEDEERLLSRIKGNIYPHIPEKIHLHAYQKEAIKNWIKNHGMGIFDMATGTGKTYTAYGAIVTLLKQAKYKLAVIILCPYQHLVEQWLEDAPLFNITDVIVGYSDYKYSDYLIKLKMAIQDYNDGIRDNLFFICTNATFKTEKVQNVLLNLRNRVLLVADEAHNLGTLNFAPLLRNEYKYRLALSATIERYRDDIGTKQIYDYFGRKCIEYDMERAINEDKLTKYYYYPIITTLSQYEIEKYQYFTNLIRKNMYKSLDGEVISNKLVEKYAIQRARLIAGAIDKIKKLREEMKNHLNEKNMLIYCGTSKLEKENGEEIRQIDEVSKMLGLELNLNIDRYTSMEDAEERKLIKKRFENGDLQALVAIKCLDEGVNIPGIKTAFILASSTNPREYIQRRGRVLRKSAGKDYAVIYDFVTLPVELDKMNQYGDNLVSDFKTLANNEIKRMEEFSRLSLNSIDSLNLITDIKNKYHLNEFITDNEFDFIKWDDKNYE